MGIENESIRISNKKIIGLDDSEDEEIDDLTLSETQNISEIREDLSIEMEH